MGNLTTTYGITLILIILLYTTTVQAQTAAAPSPPGPLNVTAVLEKAGQFTTLIRLMKSSQVADQINNQLNSSNSGITLFAPTDNAFSSLPGGTLNSLTDQQKVALIQFHILPNVVTMAQFQTVSNPLRTQAGNANNGQYPLNVTAAGNQVNISTGVDNTTVSNTLYSGSQLVVYQIDRVLLPLDIFGQAAAPAPAPATAKAKKKSAPAADEPTSSPTKDTADASAAVSLNWGASRESALIIALGFFWWYL